jgi:hypothetical protein
MAQFKFIGHSNGAAPEHDASKIVKIKGRTVLAGAIYELEVLPNEVFDISNDWTMAISSLENSSRNGKPLYQRVS